MPFALGASRTRPGSSARVWDALRAILRHIGYITIFTLPAVAIFWHAWDGHLATAATCGCSDAGQQIWFTAWPAYALSHGSNPFFSSLIWSPHGTNLLVNASSPLIGFVLAPVTWAWGPVASTNLALTLAPGLTSWGCWIACRRFVSWRWAAWLGGLLFGYSPFVFSSIRQGHLGLGLLVIPPLVLVLLDEILNVQDRPPWLAGLALGLLVVVQFFISPEVLVMMGVISVVGLFVAAILAGVYWYREKALYVAKSFGSAATAVALLLALPAWFSLAGPRHIVGAVWPNINLFGNNVNDLWDIDSLASAGAASFGPIGHSAGNLGLTGPNPSYLGFGVLTIVFLAMLVAWRRKVSWALLIAAIASFVLSLGSAGLRHDALASLSWLPWQSVVNWPLLDDVLPGRFALLTDLAASVLVAIGIDEIRKRFLHEGRASPDESRLSNRDAISRSGRLRQKLGPPVVFCVAGASMFVPIWRYYSIPTPMEAVSLPAWFAADALLVPTGSVVLAYPFPSSASLASEPMIWQAVDGMHFGLAGGYVKVPGPDGHPLTAGVPGSATNSLDLLTLVKQTPKESWAPTPADLLALRAALSSWRVSYIVITATGLNPVYTAAVMTAVSGRVPDVSDNAWVWDLREKPLGASFNPNAASFAFSSCRSQPSLYQSLSASRPLPQNADRCITHELGS